MHDLLYDVSLDCLRRHGWARVRMSITGSRLSEVLRNGKFVISKAVRALSVKVNGVRCRCYTQQSPVIFKDMSGVTSFGINVSGLRQTRLPSDTSLTFEYVIPCARVGNSETYEFSVYTAWYPIAYPLSKVAYKVAVIHDVASTVLGCGEVKVEGLDCSRRRTTIASWRPEMDIAFLIMNGLHAYELQSHKLRVTTVYDNLSEEYARTLTENSVKAYAYFCKCFRSNPLKGHLYIAVSAGFPHSYARGSLVVLSSGMLANEGDRDAILNGVKIMAHELAHIWVDFGKPLGRSKWLNEGIAEYYAIRYVNLFVHPRYLTSYFRHFINESRRFRRLRPPRTIELKHAGYVNQVYRRGAALIHQISERLGWRVFDAVIRRTRQAYPSRYVSDTEFLRALPGNLGSTAMIREWLTRSRVPEVTITVSDIYQSLRRQCVDVTLQQIHPPYDLRIELVFSNLVREAKTVLHTSERRTCIKCSFDFVPRIVVVEPHYRDIFGLVIKNRNRVIFQEARSLSEASVSRPILLSPTWLCRIAGHLGSREDKRLLTRVLRTIIRVNPKNYGVVREWALVELGRVYAKDNRPERAARMYMAALKMLDYGSLKRRSLSELKSLPEPYRSLYTDPDDLKSTARRRGA